MSDSVSSEAVKAGAAVYNQPVLTIYDLLVVGFSNRFAWRCPSPLMVDFYNENVSANHLDVGVGTGYFLDKCRFPSDKPRIALLDLNPNSLKMTAERIARYQPTTHEANVLEPLQLNTPKFDSIGLNYLLHCLPGTMKTKDVVFENLKAWLNPDGVIFGTTILSHDVQPNFLARRLMTIYNGKGIFGNREDNLADLDANLKRHFSDTSTRIVGCVALFRGRMRSSGKTT